MWDSRCKVARCATHDGHHKHLRAGFQRHKKAYRHSCSSVLCARLHAHASRGDPLTYLDEAVGFVP